nr:MAG TPA: hypothetical protein [Caudoviricetes sp.]
MQKSVYKNKPLWYTQVVKLSLKSIFVNRCAQYSSSK